MSTVYDPYPIVSHQGLSPTHEIAWERIAQTVVRRILQVERGEVVLLSADPYFGGAALDAMRCEIQRAQAIELATILHWTPQLAKLRNAQGRSPDAEIDQRENAAMAKLFNCADVFILLMNDRRGGRTVATSQSDQVVEQWQGGRSAHLHWFHDPALPDPAHPINLAHDRVNEAAIVELDYDGVRRVMQRLIERTRDRELRLTDSSGTDLRFQVGIQYHCNYGDASRPRMQAMSRGRDREEEVPIGSFRFIPVAGTARGTVVFPRRRDGESPALGRGFDTSAFVVAGLRFEYRDGEVVAVHTAGDQAALNHCWQAEHGDKGKLGEIILGCNPLLVPVAGSGFLPHYGFGAGVIRLILGDNTLSGGNYRSSFHRWLMWGDATLDAPDGPIVDKGQLCIAP